jgi:hypothetical protein
MADPEKLPPGDEGPEPKGSESEQDAARIRAAIGEGLRKFYDSVADEPIPAEWLALVGAKPEERSS